MNALHAGAKYAINRSRLSARAAICLGLFSLAGCSNYQGISPVGYEYSKALYSITNRQATAALDRVEKQIAAAETAGELPAKEARWLAEVVAAAHAEDWQTANRTARRMMEDQVE